MRGKIQQFTLQVVEESDDTIKFQSLIHEGENSTVKMAGYDGYSMSWKFQSLIHEGENSTIMGGLLRKK